MTFDFPKYILLLLQRKGKGEKSQFPLPALSSSKPISPSTYPQKAPRIPFLLPTTPQKSPHRISFPFKLGIPFPLIPPPPP